MAELFSEIHFTQRHYLWLLAAMPVLWLALRRGAFFAVLWRGCLYGLLVLALAEPQRVAEKSVALKPEKVERVFAFDLSRSIPETMRGWMIETAKKEVAIKPEDRVFVFSREVREVTDWEKWLRDAALGESVGPERTDLAALLSAVLRLPRAPRELYLFSDGWENRGSAADVALALSASELKVFPLLPPGRPAIANVAVAKVTVPHHGASGDSVHLKVTVENDGVEPAGGTLVLSRGEETLGQLPVTIRPGSQLYDFPAVLKAGPLEAFQARFLPEDTSQDRFPEDNRATAWVAVRNREKVLLLSSSPGENRYLEELLKRRGYEVVAAGPDGAPPAPAGFAAVVFNNVGRERFPPAYLAEIERQVAAGKAFLMVGGERSFGLGGYRQTPIERILPVELREPEEKNRAVVLVIDKSGSMRDEDKLLYAKEAAKAMARQLAERDLLGVVGFDVTPFVVVPLAPLERIRPTLDVEIDRLKPGGKTYLLPAIVEARRQLERQSANRKHVIILSDGETGGSGGDYIDLIAIMKEELKITVSAVAIGDQANIPLLKRIAQYGGGLFHHTYDPRTLPQIVLGEIQEKPEVTPLMEEEFVPMAVPGSELLAGPAFRTYPRLRGFIETAIKPGAKQDLVVRRAGAPVAPLLASWRYGRGRTVAFTTDMHGRWSRDWIAWDGLERFWGRLFQWLIPPKEDLAPHEVRVNQQGDKALLDFYLYQEKSGAGSLRYSLSGPGAEARGSLKRLAPGRYRAELPVGVPGDYRIELVEERASENIPYPPVGYTLPFDPKAEIPRETVNLPLLERLAGLSGGAINPAPRPPSTQVEVIRSVRGYRTEITFLALVLLLIDFVARRLLRSPAG